MFCHQKREFLYVILPYFNFCGFKRRKDLFIQFVERMKKTNGVRIVISELAGESLLPKNLKVFRHLTFTNQSMLWTKENLVNNAVKTLPDDWTCVAWIDADISFLNKNWVKETLQSLEKYDVVQLFQTAVNLGPTNEAIKIDKSFGYMHVDSGTELIQNDKYGFWHPGFAWACTKHAWKRSGGLVDWAILGSADRHMAYALKGRVLESAPGTIHPNYTKLLLDFQKRVNGLYLGYVSGTIFHHWHGSLKNRKYRERWEILTKKQYDPLKDIYKDDAGVLNFTTRGHRMDKDMYTYFIGRKEDDLQNS